MPGLRAYWLPKSSEFARALQLDFLSEQAFIPLDPDSPAERIRFILEQVRPTELVTDEKRIAQLQLRGAKHALLENGDGGMKWGLEWEDAGPALPRDLAYILYTSGSTGTPKGVVITRANALAFIDWAAKALPLDSEDTVASIAPFHFDLSVYDLHLTARLGANLWVPKEEVIKNPRWMCEALAESGATVLYCTPTFLSMLLRFGKPERHDLSAIRRIMFAGEPFPPADLMQAMDAFPQAEFYNLYGPTETNVVTWWSVPRDWPCQEVCPIGRAASEAELIRDHRGELWVKGPSVSPGYVGGKLDHSDGTAYATGDAVEEIEPGCFRYLGRLDRMVKRRGYRIEPAEIESAFKLHPDLLQAAVAVLDGPTLVLCYETKPDCSPLDFVQLSAFGLQHLPTYLLPDRYQQIVHWPVTSSGKLDRVQLKKIASDEY